MTEIDKSHLLLVLTGPSGVGKDTVLDKLAQHTPLSRVVTWTDRPPKPGEIEGVHYHFTSTGQFRTMIDQGDFLEWVEYGADPSRGIPGTLKGTTKNSLYPPVDRHLVWRIDPSRAASIKDTFYQTLTEDQATQLLTRTLVIYLTVESLHELRDRQLQRDGQVDQARLDHDRQYWENCDSLFKNVVVNRLGKIDDTVSEILQLMSSAHNTEL